MSSPNKKQKLADIITEATPLVKDLVNIVVHGYFPALYLYHLTHSVDYPEPQDYYSNLIVVAPNAEVAKTIAPQGHRFLDGKWHWGDCFYSTGFYLHGSRTNNCLDTEYDHSYHGMGFWPKDLDLIQVTEIGISTDRNHREGDIICYSYNRGS
jgi:hypothetical protein